MTKTRNMRKIRTKRRKNRGGMFSSTRSRLSSAASRASRAASSFSKLFRGTRVAPQPPSPPRRPPFTANFTRENFKSDETPWPLPRRSPPREREGEFKSDETPPRPSPHIASNDLKKNYNSTTSDFIKSYENLQEHFKPNVSGFYTKEYIIGLLEKITRVSDEIKLIIDFCIIGESIGKKEIYDIYQIPENMKRATIELNALMIIFETLIDEYNEKVIYMELANKALIPIINRLLTKLNDYVN